MSAAGRAIFTSTPKQRDNDPNEKRRMQAIEAMQIAEQRRRRLALDLSSDEEDKTLAEDFQKLNVRAVEYLPDGRLKLTHQQLVARNLKRKRIEKHLKEQEARKKKDLEKNKRKVVHFKKKNIDVVPAVLEKEKDKPKIIRYTKDELRELNARGFYFMY
ncbi:hypothetical protein PVAND_005672 [Polypedilum vanderplanki]|uniref:Uncharacterized protein n=1 Tax=Polypedilum vanderplanki TaxID=319348 RepID=A0A9J6C2R8_POLVA|nr:hypothetical protein PVAND_005672 [Polypedilum vanderplanki]